MKLIIVESPTKSKTIAKFLGKDYTVLSSYGHIRDLPQKELGVDVKKDFKPTYVVPEKAKKRVTALRKELKNSSSVILATDEDREGESIAWHLKKLLKLDDPDRIVFHEITKPAIEKALNSPRKLNMDLVDAQQARRILDRLVGYKLSPFLWKKVVRGLSAGRVQSVAVRLICQKEEDIKKFKPEEYWEIKALFKKGFEADLIKQEIKSKRQADTILKNLNKAEYIVEKIEKKQETRNPLPPFKTSTLQQQAVNRLHFSSKKTMAFAQKLYERGFITYHRTDSLNLSQESQQKAKSFIEKQYGQEYYKERFFKTKSSSAQEAHEAIRPTKPELTPDEIKLKDPASKKLYTLIWQRFMASQMTQAIFDSTKIDIKAKNYIFRSTGQTLKFAGFLKVYPIKFTENELPTLKEKETLELKTLESSQHFTNPPARYSEASLIKALEKEEIGRPSTYAPILDTIQRRGYVEKNDNKKFAPTKIGSIVDDLLKKHFPEIVDLQFTAKMEKELDEIAEGKDSWQKTIKDFWEPFSKNLSKKTKEVEKIDLTEKTNEKCPECKAPLIIRMGRYGKFYACSKFPNCKYTKPLKKPSLNIPCPKCKKGELVEKNTRTRKTFYGCSLWPKCDFALWDKPTKEKCPKCGSLMVETKQGLKCSKCDVKKQTKKKS